MAPLLFSSHHPPLLFPVATTGIALGEAQPCTDGTCGGENSRSNIWIGMDMNSDIDKAAPQETAGPQEKLQGRSSEAPLFALGKIVATPAAMDVLQVFCFSPLRLLARHVRGDWGDVDGDDAEMNRRSLILGMRLMSVYTLKRVVDGQARTQKVWVITEADRSVTTVLLPDDY
jgi:hypothetical protein